MITDYWIIVQIIGQLSTLIIFTAAFGPAIKILRQWNINSSDAQQTELERKTYLVSVILHYTVLFQFVLLLLFVEIVNNHLSALINGAMCAQGTLDLNAYGFPALYIKVVSIVFYAIFIFINYLDQAEPYYPLTPAKFRMMPLLFLLILTDFILTFRYFYLIKPDVIATCCSISFSGSLIGTEQGAASGIIQFYALILYYVITIFLLLMLIFKKKYLKSLIIVSFLFVTVALIALKDYFVRYIYARPTHNCLFDILWREYNYVGFLLYGLLLLLIIVVAFMYILGKVQNKLKKNYNRLSDMLSYFAIICIVFFTLIIHFYWINWIVKY